MPNNEQGAWWLLDGRFVTGGPDSSPQEGAVWRTYYESAKRALSLFAEGNIGLERLSYHLNEEGYPFGDRAGQPRKWCRDDVRRVLANWPEYGGVVLHQPAKKRRSYTREEADNIQLDPERTVFPVELLTKVAHTLAYRTIFAIDRGDKTEAYPYPLSHITRCAHCEKLVQQENDPRLRTYLGGTQRKNGRVYRHKAGVRCGCAYRSVSCDLLEEGFGKLIKGLVVNEEAFQPMLSLAHEMSPDVDEDTSEQLNMAQKRERSIIKMKKKLENLKMLFREAEIEEEEYRARLAEYRAELAYWEAYQTEAEQVALQLSLCLEAIGKVARLWDIAEPQERRTMAQNLFDFIVYDLDKQQIVDFRLKPWASQFLVVRALMENEERIENASLKGVRRNVPPRGVGDLLRLQRYLAAYRLLDLIFPILPRCETKTPHQTARNKTIRKRHAEGELVIDLSREYQVSPQRISQIVRQLKVN